jgi:hypothetical protein
VAAVMRLWSCGWWRTADDLASLKALTGKGPADRALACTAPAETLSLSFPRTVAGKRHPTESPTIAGPNTPFSGGGTLLRSKGGVLGTVEATDAHAAENVAAIQFELDEFQRRRLLVREIG